MKNSFSKVFICLVLVCVFVFSKAQTANTAPAKSASEQLHDQQVKKATDITTRITNAANITDDQKTKLQASMLEAVVNYNDAVLKAKKAQDEARLSSLNQELVNDITARIKAILTPEQFNLVMSKESNQ